MSALTSPPDSDVAARVICQKYRLESVLGEGGMGSVWRAFNLQLEVPVAIKLLRAGLDMQDLRERLRVEARAAAKLVHPSIVRVFDIGESESGEPFIVMELLTGESLGQMIERGPLPAANAIQLLLPIAEALSLAHSRGVVHRDLKPDNIFLAAEGDCLQPKLLDFGIAKVTSTVAAGGASLTQTGTLLGSPEYMSPEQAYGRGDVDARSDVWSFCVLLYETLSGSSPFTGTSCQSILRSVVQDDPMPLELFTAVDARLSGLILRGLAKDRELRPGSIFELGQELAAWLFDQGVQEDVTGASLEAKWLGRSSDSLLLTRPRSVAAPRAQHEHATLVSVVHPMPRPVSEPLLELPIRRGRRWLPSALVAAAAIVGGVTWASLSGFEAGAAAIGSLQATEPARASSLQAAPTAAHAAAVTALAASPPVAVIEASAKPAEPAQRAALDAPTPVSKLPSSVATQRVAVSQAAIATTDARSPSQRPSAESAALPQALPSRDPAQDLLDPY